NLATAGAQGVGVGEGAGVGVDGVAQCGVGDLDRPAELLGASAQVEGVQPVVVVRHTGDDLLALGGDVERIGCRVDDRSAGDADFGGDVGAVGLAGRHRGLAGCEHRDLPQYVAGVAVDGVDAIVLGGDVRHVVHAGERAHGNAGAGDVERLRVDLAVDRSGPVLAELRD